MDTFIILELIPTTIKKETGDVIQLSAIRINNNKVVDRFDYRLVEEKIPFTQLLDIISYDKEAFTYKNTTDEIMEEFDKWSENYPLYILDNEYTKNYLEDITNEKKSIVKELGMEYHDRVVEEIIDKYKLQPSNYIVDLLFEALIFSNNK